MKTLVILLVLLNCCIANAQYFTGTVQYKVDKFKNFTLNTKDTPSVVLHVGENALLIKTQNIKTNTSGSQFYIDFATKKMFFIRNYDSSYIESELGTIAKKAMVDATTESPRILGYKTNSYNISMDSGRAVMCFSPELIIKTTNTDSTKKVIPSYVPLKIEMTVKISLVDSIEIALTAIAIQKTARVDYPNIMQPYFEKALRKKTADSVKRWSSSNTYDDPVIIYSTVEVSENLPGGFGAFVKKNSNIKPKDCSCKVGFWVEKDGSVMDPKIESTNCKKEKFKKEALRLVTLSSGRWAPFMRNGAYLRVYRTETISFK